MDMLLRDMTHDELANLLARHADTPSLPHLRNPDARRRARELARRGGVWTALDSLDASADIPVVRRSVYRQFQRSGSRVAIDQVLLAKLHRLQAAALAVWLDHPAADIDHVQDLIWSFCDDWTWVGAAHEGMTLDLYASAVGIQIAETITLLSDRLETEVTDRARREIERRIFEPATAWNHPQFWKTARMNWNHVCNGLLIEIALCLINQPAVLANVIHAPIRGLTYGLDGFTDDGGCVEGPGYWDYGFGHYVRAAFALHQRTGGELNLMTADAKIRRICRYPLASMIDPPLRAAFADGGHGYTGATCALLINRFFDEPQLLSCCQRNADDTLRLRTWHELALGDDRTPPAFDHATDACLPELGQVKLVGKTGPSQLTLAAIAGHNGVPHNHNDIGSFMVVRGGRLLLEDPGAPVYTRDTFNEHRYECDLVNSRGHSLPVINGKLQVEGGRHYGTLSTAGLNGDGEKTATIDMTHAYPRGTVKQLLRTFRMDPAANAILLTDEYAFARKPSSVEEAFITRQKVSLLDGGQAVQIGPKRGGLTLRAVDTPGRFHMETMETATAQSRQPEKMITRIRFIPDQLAVQMRLAFSMR